MEILKFRGGTPTRDTYFPILDDRRRWPGKAKPFLDSVSSDDRAYIQSLQPFESSTGYDRATHSLHRLRLINDFDKHRVLLATWSVPPRFIYVRPDPPDALFGDTTHRSETGWDHNDRTEIIRVATEAGRSGIPTKFKLIPPTDEEVSLYDLNPQMQVDINKAISVAFLDKEQGLIQTDIFDLRTLLLKVRAVIGHFEAI